MGEVFSPPISVYIDHAFEELKWIVTWPLRKLTSQYDSDSRMPQLIDNEKYRRWKEAHSRNNDSAMEMETLYTSTAVPSMADNNGFGG